MSSLIYYQITVRDRTLSMWEGWGGGGGGEEILWGP